MNITVGQFVRNFLVDSISEKSSGLEEIALMSGMALAAGAIGLCFRNCNVGTIRTFTAEGHLIDHRNVKATKMPLSVSVASLAIGVLGCFYIGFRMNEISNLTNVVNNAYPLQCPA